MMNEQESGSNDYLRPPLWHGKLAFGKVALRLTLQKSDTSQKGVKRFRQASLFELDEPFEQKFPVIRRRLLVLGLYLSFLACVTGLWLTANVTGGLEQKLPSGIAELHSDSACRRLAGSPVDFARLLFLAAPYDV